MSSRPVIETALTDLWYGFGVALQPHNLMWCFIGVLVGNMVGVLPGNHADGASGGVFNLAMYCQGATPPSFIQTDRAEYRE
jgi:hypothetical protein